jgi:dipeptidyl aminopeptidase/acylaminoacyl peptidase
MTKPCFVLLLLLPGLLAAQSAEVKYQQPPAAILKVMEAPRPPVVSASPTRDRLLLMQTVDNPDIADVAAPMLRIAGIRIDPATNGLHLARTVRDLRLETIADGKEVPVALPDAISGLTAPVWSPDGKRFAFTHITPRGIELWVGDAATGTARRLPGVRVNAVMRGYLQWMKAGSSGFDLLVETVAAGRGAAPAANPVPEGPRVTESDGRALPARTYEDLLKTPHDADLFDYYATSQLARVNPVSGAMTPIGKPAIFAEASPAPDGRHFLIARIHRPYSYLVPNGDFPHTYEVWSAAGRLEHSLRDFPLRSLRPGFTQTGARGFEWQPMQPATLQWEEALDEGNPRTAVPFRDRVLTLAAPFTGAPAEMLKTEYRYAGIQWGSAGDIALLSERDRKAGEVNLFFDPRNPASQRPAWTVAPQEHYRDPGTPVEAFGATLGGRASAGGRGNAIMLEEGGAIYLRGAGASDTGDHPFLDRYNTASEQSERLFQSPAGSYETVADLLSPDAAALLVAHESQSDPPNYYVRAPHAAGLGRALTHYADPAPEVRRIKKQLIRYKRNDGVELSTMVYFPPEYQPGTRYPAIVWAYPAEFGSASAAGEVSGSSDRFTIMRGYSELYLALDGYVVLDNMTMPILSQDGNLRDANDSYVEQLVEDARAGVEAAANLGFIDPARVGVAGHSYGAFMVANLLAHSSLFKAGNAQSGAYNRTLTPFGFQNEERTYWDDPQLYYQMSPFDFADKIKAPLLLIHGMADDNAGTFPEQSERMYAAVQGMGGTVRFVYLPDEAHGYLAQQTIEHVVWEMDRWFGKYVKKGTGNRE